jgi:hypothetical protein
MSRSTNVFGQQASIDSGRVHIPSSRKSWIRGEVVHSALLPWLPGLANLRPHWLLQCGTEEQTFRNQEWRTRRRKIWAWLQGLSIRFSKYGARMTSGECIQLLEDAKVRPGRRAPRTRNGTEQRQTFPLTRGYPSTKASPILSLISWADLNLNGWQAKCGAGLFSSRNWVAMFWDARKEGPD